MLQLIEKAIEDCLFGEEEPRFLPHAAADSMRILWSQHDEQARMEFRRSVLPELLASARKIVRFAARPGHSESLRVFCVAEESDNLLMWAHYASDHAGLVFGLDVLDHGPLCLGEARQVRYQQNLPSVPPISSIVNTILGLEGERVNLETLGWTSFLTKSTDWAYEKEWRSVKVAETRPGATFEARSFLPAELKAVYFGIRMEPATQAKIQALLQRDFDHVAQYQAEPSTETYSVFFRELPDS